MFSCPLTLLNAVEVVLPCLYPHLLLLRPLLPSCVSKSVLHPNLSVLEGPLNQEGSSHGGGEA